MSEDPYDEVEILTDEEIAKFDEIDCSNCPEIYSITTAKYVDGDPACPNCGHIEGESFE